MHMGFGGNPYGPAGTGKTESVKALGQALGRQVKLVADESARLVVLDASEDRMPPRRRG